MHLSGALLACAALGFAFRDVRLERVTELLGAVGGWGLLAVLAPQFFTSAFETLGWRLAWPAPGAPFAPLLRVRIASESLCCLPAGVLLAESAKIALLVRRSGLNVARAVAAVSSRKYLLLTSQSLYIGLAAVFGSSALAAASHAVVGHGALPWLVFAAAVVLASAGAAVRFALSSGTLASRVRERLLRSRLRPLRSAVAAHAHSFGETDREVQRFFRLPAERQTRMTAWFLAGWLVEALETFLILRLLGVELDFVTVASFEVVLSLLRSLVFVVPAGLGVQDAGYALFLRALGVPDAIAAGAAFALIKRGKELAWAAAGFALLSVDLRAGADGGSLWRSGWLVPERRVM